VAGWLGDRRVVAAAAAAAAADSWPVVSGFVSRSLMYVQIGFQRRGVSGHCPVQSTRSR